MEMFNCHVSESAIYAATKVLQSKQLSEGRRVKDFELELESQLNLRNPVCTNSGTSALHLSLLLAGVGPGMEVILPAQTFIATGMAVLYCGATPVFADIDPETGNLDPESARPKLTPKTRAILAVDWCGLPCDYQELNAMERITVADAAHSLGAMYRNVAAGRWADFAAYSFQATKHLITGDGGAVCGSMPITARRLRWFDLSRTPPRHCDGSLLTAAYEVGFKYHMNDLAASVGLGNLYGFKARLARRQLIGQRYRDELANVPGLRLLRLPTDRTHAYYAFPVLVDRREDFARALSERGVPATVISRRIDRNPIFGDMREDLPKTTKFDLEQINLPCHDELTDNDVSQVIESVKKGW